MSRIYLLTGAAGLLGSNISRQLIQKGEKVRAFVLENDPAAKYIPEGAEIVYGDLCDVDSLEKLFDVPEEYEVYVIHSASIVTLRPEPNPKVHAVNVGGTVNIINKCLEHHVKKLVYISSTSAIPELPHGQKIKEVDHFLPTDGLVGYYAVTKAEASQKVLDAVSEHEDFDASIVHPSGICGPNDYSFGPVAQIVSQYMNGEMKIGLEGTFNSVDVRDLADGVIACCDKGRRGECYIMSNELVTMRDIYNLINEAANLDIHASILSKGIANIAVKALKIQSRFTGQEPLLTEFGIYNLTRNNDYDCSKAEKDLGFNCRPFAETIRDEVVWLQEEAANNAEGAEEAQKTVAAVKERVKYGDIENVIVKKNDSILFKLPIAGSIAAGVGGILFAPYAVIPGAIIAYGQDVQVQLETKSGEILDIHGHKI